MLLAMPPSRSLSEYRGAPRGTRGATNAGGLGGPVEAPHLPRRPLRVLHTADVHLDSDGYGTAEQQAAHLERGRRLLQRMVDQALADQVDLLLIAGDLFDHNRVPERSSRSSGPSSIGSAAGRPPAWEPRRAADKRHLRPTRLRRRGSHVHVIRQLDGRPSSPEIELLVWGRAMEEHEPLFRPLAHIPGRDERRWCVAMGHGFFYEEQQRPERRRRYSPTRCARRAGTTLPSVTTTTGSTSAKAGWPPTMREPR